MFDGLTIEPQRIHEFVDTLSDLGDRDLVVVHISGGEMVNISTSTAQILNYSLDEEVVEVVKAWDIIRRSKCE